MSSTAAARVLCLVSQLAAKRACSTAPNGHESSYVWLARVTRDNRVLFDKEKFCDMSPVERLYHVAAALTRQHDGELRHGCALLARWAED